MRCTSPRTVGFKADGTLAWRSREMARESVSFQLPCGKCLECRAEYARSWAVRCVHESTMHDDNCFITLTYDDDHLPLGGRLDYRDWQLFAKRLRRALPSDQLISTIQAGEYGEKNKRPHWHACIFGWKPEDMEYRRTSDRGDKLYTSQILEDLWGKNDPEACPTEVGAVTFESAGYVCQYALKKLQHGLDGSHDFNPIFRQSSKRAIGRSFIERYWADVFHTGAIILEDGTQTTIPRYYEKWFMKHFPWNWERYVTQKKSQIIEKISYKAEVERQKEILINAERRDRPDGYRRGNQITKNAVRRKLAIKRAEELQEARKQKL